MLIVLVVLAIAAVALLILGPGWWIKHTLNKYSEPANRYQGTGAELARHLLDQAGLQHVKVERTERGDHYDPLDKAVRLSELCFDQRSLTAVTVAAHEVGHALQDRDEGSMLHWRTRLARVVNAGDKLALVLMLAAPFMALLSRSSMLLWLFVIAAVSIQALGALMHLVTLPVEWDASFGRALPMLEQLKILHAADYPHARRLLRAAAFTYVAASLYSLLLLARWIR